MSKEKNYADLWSKAIDQAMREYHQSCLDRGFYCQGLMDRYGARPIAPSTTWTIFSTEETGGVSGDGQRHD